MEIGDSGDHILLAREVVKKQGEDIVTILDLKMEELTVLEKGMKKQHAKMVTVVSKGRWLPKYKRLFVRFFFHDFF